MNSGSFTLHTVSPMQHLQAVMVRNSKPLGFCFGDQESEPYPRTQMSDRPAHSSRTFLKKVFKIIVTHYFSLGLGALGPWVDDGENIDHKSIISPINITLHIHPSRILVISLNTCVESSQSSSHSQGVGVLCSCSVI